MAQELEIEFKNLVTNTEFHSLLAYFQLNDRSFISQDNHYFDTAQFDLKEKGSALRIRYKHDSYTLTLKTPVEEGLLETNQHLSKQEAEALLNMKEFPKGEVFDMLALLKIPFEQLLYFGTLTTSRAEIDYKDGLLVFDKSSYLNKEDFELEYEVTNRLQGEQNFFALLKEMNIPVRKTENKIKRFYNEKYKQG